VTVPAEPGTRLICLWGLDLRTGALGLIASREIEVTEPVVDDPVEGEP
jgi:hypothetical protein